MRPQIKDQNSKKCLVLGANGFVGSHLCESLAKNNKVIAFDRFSKPPQFDDSSGIEIVHGDINNDEELRNSIKQADYVMHSFSATTPFVSDKDPYRDIIENLHRSVRIFEICAEESIEKIGFISSAGTVYGSATENRTAAETDAPLPVSPYGIIKLSIEHYLEYFKRKYSMDYTVYRLTNPYGPRQVTKNSQGVIPTFIHKIINHEELTIYGDGKSSRDYIYMKDAADMISVSFTSNSIFPVYNIGSGVQTSLLEIIESLEKIANITPKVRYAGAPKTFLEHNSVSIDRYNSEFKPSKILTLEQGLAETFLKANQQQ